MTENQEQNSHQVVSLRLSEEPETPKTSAKREAVKQESKDERDKVLTEVKTDLDRQVRESATELEKAGNSIDGETQKYLEQYFDSAINRFDADKDGKIDVKEAGKFREDMKSKTSEIIESKKRAEEAKESVKDVDEFTKADSFRIEEAMDSIQDLGDLSDIQQANAEVQKIQIQNEAFQHIVSEEITKANKINKKLADFQQRKEGFGAFQEFIKVVSNSQQRDKEIQDLKQQLEEAKKTVNDKLENLKAKQKILDGNGEKIRACFAKTRAETIQKREEKKEEAKQFENENKEKINEFNKRYEEIGKVKKEMIEKQNAIQERQKQSVQIREQWERDESLKIQQQTEGCKAQEGEIAAEIAGLRLILNNSDVPPSVKEDIEKVLQDAQKRQKANKAAIGYLTQKLQIGTACSRQLTAEEEKLGKKSTKIDEYLSRQSETQASLQENINRLSEIQLQYATSASQIDKLYNESIGILDEQTKNIDDFILNSSMSRQQSIVGLENTKKQLESVKPESIGAFSFFDIFSAPIKGVGDGLTSLAGMIDKGVHKLLENEKGLSYMGAQILGVFAGLTSGVLEMGGGIMTLTSGLSSDLLSVLTFNTNNMHFDTFKGLGGLIGYDAVKGEFSWDALKNNWGTMIGSLVGWNEFGESIDLETGKKVQREGYGLAAGKAAANIILAIVTAGSGTAATGAGATARGAGIVSRLGKMSTAAKAASRLAKAGGKGVLGRMKAGVKVGGKELVSVLKPKGAFDFQIFRDTFGKGKLAYTGHVAKESFKGIGTGIWKAGKRAKEVVSDIVKHPWKTTKSVGKMLGSIILMPYKLAYNLMRGAGKGLMRLDNSYVWTSRMRLTRASRSMAKYEPGALKMKKRITEFLEEEHKTTASTTTSRKIAYEKGDLAERKQIEIDVLNELAKKDPNLSSEIYDYLRYNEAFDSLIREGNIHIQNTEKSISKIKQEPGWQEWESNKTTFAKENPRDAARYEQAELASGDIAEFKVGLDNLRKDSLDLFDPAVTKLLDQIQNIESMNPGEIVAYLEDGLKSKSQRDISSCIDDVMQQYGLDSTLTPAVQEAFNGLKLRAEKKLRKPPRLDEKLFSDTVKELKKNNIPFSGKSTPTALDKWLTEAKNTYSPGPINYDEIINMLYTEETNFLKILKRQQKSAIKGYEDVTNMFDTKDLSGIKQDPAFTGLSQDWQDGVEAIHKRYTFGNEAQKLIADTAISRIKANFAECIKPGMTPEEAAKALNKRFGKGYLPDSALHTYGRNLQVADNIMLTPKGKSSPSSYFLELGADGKLKFVDTPSGINVPSSSPPPYKNLARAEAKIKDLKKERMNLILDLQKAKESLALSPKDSIKQKFVTDIEAKLVTNKNSLDAANNYVKANKPSVFSKLSFDPNTNYVVNWPAFKTAFVGRHVSGNVRLEKAANGPKEFVEIAPGETTKKVETRSLHTLGASDDNNKIIYTEAEREYIADIKNTIETALYKFEKDGFVLDEKNVEDYVLNQVFEEKDAMRDYTVEVDGIKITVDKEGNKTYTGIDRWIAAKKRKK